MSTLRANPETRRSMTAEERAETRALADDLTVTLWPASHWTSDGERLWFCTIVRAENKVAEAAHGNLMASFRTARAMLERATAPV